MRGSLKSIEDMSITAHEKNKKSKQIANTSIILMQEQQTKKNIGNYLRLHDVNTCLYIRNSLSRRIYMLHHKRFSFDHISPCSCICCRASLLWFCKIPSPSIYCIDYKPRMKLSYNSQMHSADAWTNKFSPH
jgi:hypothetical protein